jgi:hypothetical protein
MHLVPVQRQWRMHVQTHRQREVRMSRSTTGVEYGLPSPIHHGIGPANPPGLAWRKSAHSNSSGSCVELARLPDGGQVAMRNSRYPDGPVLVYAHDEIVAFIEAAKDGAFDDLIG